MKPSLIGFAVLGYYALPLVAYSAFGARGVCLGRCPDGVEALMYGVPILLVTTYLVATGR